MDDLQTMLSEARQRHAHFVELLAERSAAVDAARELLAQDSTYPRRRREIEAELSAAETDLQWISRDLTPLADRVRLLESDLGDVMAREVELAAAENARATKVGSQGKRAKPPTGGETNVASSQAEAPAGA